VAPNNYTVAVTVPAAMPSAVMTVEVDAGTAIVKAALLLDLGNFASPPCGELCHGVPLNCEFFPIPLCGRI
jgi:hypothetical protein